MLGRALLGLIEAKRSVSRINGSSPEVGGLHLWKLSHVVAGRETNQDLKTPRHCLDPPKLRV